MTLERHISEGDYTTTEPHGVVVPEDTKPFSLRHIYRDRAYLKRVLLSPSSPEELEVIGVDHNRTPAEVESDRMRLFRTMEVTSSVQVLRRLRVNVAAPTP